MMTLLRLTSIFSLSYTDYQVLDYLDSLGIYRPFHVRTIGCAVKYCILIEVGTLKHRQE